MTALPALFVAAAFAQDAPPGASACPGTTVRELVVALESAESSYAQADLPAFQASTDTAYAIVPCLTEPLTRASAARLHRTLGLRAYVDREEDRAIRAFAAARSIEPAYAFPEDLVPSGNPVLGTYKALSVENPQTVEAPAPKEGRLTFDGRDAALRPVSWPTVFQRFADDGSVAVTAYLQPSDALPAYEPLVKPAPATGGGASEGKKKKGKPQLRSELLVGSGAVALMSVSSAALSARAHALYDDPSTQGEAVLTGLRRQTNGYATASIALGAVAAAGVGASFTLATW